MRGKSKRKKSPPPSFMKHPKWTGGGPYTVWKDFGTASRPMPYEALPMPDDPALFRALYEAVDYARELDSRQMGRGGHYAIRNGAGQIVWRSLTPSPGTWRDPPRKRRAHRTRSKADYIASLEWNIKDAEEALRAALSMRKWSGVIKYAKQLDALEQKLYQAGASMGPRRSSRVTTIQRAIATESTAGHRYGRGRLP